MSAAFGANPGSVLMHQLRRRASEISCSRSTPDLVLGDIAQMLGQQGAVPTRITIGRSPIQSHEDPPLIPGIIMPRPLRGASAIPADPCRAKRPRHLLTVAGRVPNWPAAASL